MRQALTVCIASLVVVGCGRQQATETTTKVVFNQPVSLKGDIGPVVPAHLPVYARLFPGASVASNVHNPRGASRHGLIIYQTRASPEAVLGFYRRSATQAGLRTVADTRLGPQGRQFMAKGPNGQSVSVTVGPSTNGTLVTMSYE